MLCYSFAVIKQKRKMNKIHLPSINIVKKIFRCLNAWYNRHMEKPSFKQVIVINRFSLHQNSTNVNIIFEGDG